MNTRAVAPWVRTRLRAAPGAAVALAVLVLVTAFLAAAFPRALDRYQDAGLRHQIASSPASQRNLRLMAAEANLDHSPEARESALAPGTMKDRFQAALRIPERPLRVDSASSAYGVRLPQRSDATDKWLPRVSPRGPQFLLTTRSELPRHSRLVAGRAPVHTLAPRAPAGDPPGPPEVVALEATVTSATAETMRIKAGSVVHLDALPLGGKAEVRVTGIVEPLAPKSPYWSIDTTLHTPELVADKTGDVSHWVGTLMLPPEAGPALTGLTAAPEQFWDLAPGTGGLTAPDVPRLTSAVAALESGHGLVALREEIGETLTVASDFEGLVDAYRGARAAIDPVVAVAAFGVGAVAGVVLLMAGALAGARRAAELALLRARGGSLWGMAGRLCAELAVVAVPAAAAGWLAAYLLLPGARTTASVLAAAAVALVACTGLPVRAAVAHLRPSAHSDRTDTVRARPSRRRTVAELTVVVLTLGAVVALRRRGTDAGTDQLVSAAPVLVGVVASLLLVRLYPLPLRLVSRPLALRRGAVGFLSAARAGRAPATAMLPLLALLIALTTAAFGGSVLAGVADSRQRAATDEVGADARLQKGPGKSFDARSLAAVRAAAGVREVSPVGIDPWVSMPDGGDDVTLLAVDPASYARLAARTGIGAFDAAALDGGGEGRAFPVLASPKAAQRLGRGTDVELRSHLLGGSFTARTAQVVPSTPALRDTEFLMVSSAALPGHRPTALMVTGEGLDPTALRSAAGPAVPVHVRTERIAAYADGPLQQGAGGVYVSAVAAGAGYAVLAVLLSLLQAAPERRALLARLRTMGLSRGSGRGLLVFESLPQALLAACGGVLVSWAAIRLLAPDIDLDTLALAARAQAGITVPVALRPDAWSLFVPALAVVGVAVGVAAGQAWWTTRRTTTTELRAGDTR
ncbi:FtsX-like permease family protein [Streptomyces candidus]|uniref:Putative ABC transport system permease protein n=1 Tax=Streptomyces candidus TaxID=67283 RepID=A0A7X0HIQ7_9ACTN|nr:FtsX-like permease family protein [Streptomyces candidus]MBB6437089.1 putative ABC transport system permease protein [Streptomyces candidus]GHH32936.1 membrane protein [Streptomyces candidus]